jgi:RNA polymerase sigma-70 factor (ECF subfamily)
MAAPDPARSTTPTGVSDDQTLVRRMTLRDEAALGELYDRYAGLLLAVARRVLGPGPEAEEVLQDAFFQAWLQADRYQSSRSSVSTGLVLIARSRALDRLRSRQAGARKQAAAAAEPRPGGEASAGAEARVLHEQRRVRVSRALAELPAEQREVLEAAFYGGLSQTEIAAQTATPLGTVKTRALLGMKKLRQALREELRELM